MKKKRIFLTIVLILLFTFSFASANNDTGIKLFIDGDYVESSIKPILQNGRTLIPIRLVSETMGIEVKWDDATRTVTLKQDSDVISFQIGGKSATKNKNLKIAIDVPATLVNGSTFVPVRFVAEAFGKKVDWDNDTSTVIIGEKRPSASSNSNNAKSKLKVIPTKDYVYSTDTQSMINVKSYKVLNDKEVYGANIQFPIININSDYAREINKKLKEAHESNISSYNNMAKVSKDKRISYTESSYNHSVFGDVLSVTVITRFAYIASTDLTETARFSYDCYNFNIKTGDKIEDTQLLEIMGFNGMTDLYKNLINININNEYEYTLNPDIAKSIFENYFNFLNTPYSYLYLKNNNLMLIVRESIYDNDAQKIVLKKNLNLKDEINPAFTKLKIPNDRNFGIVFLGRYNKETQNDIILKTSNFVKKYLNSSDDISVINDDYISQKDIGENLYLVIPKYKNSIITRMAKDGTYVYYKSAFGNAIVSYNDEDNKKDYNSNIVYIHNDVTEEFQPYYNDKKNTVVPLDQNSKKTYYNVFKELSDTFKETGNIIPDVENKFRNSFDYGESSITNDLTDKELAKKHGFNSLDPVYASLEKHFRKIAKEYKIDDIKKFVAHHMILNYPNYIDNINYNSLIIVGGELKAEVQVVTDFDSDVKTQLVDIESDIKNSKISNKAFAKLEIPDKYSYGIACIGEMTNGKIDNDLKNKIKKIAKYLDVPEDIPFLSFEHKEIPDYEVGKQLYIVIPKYENAIIGIDDYDGSYAEITNALGNAIVASHQRAAGASLAIRYTFFQEDFEIMPMQNTKSKKMAIDPDDKDKIFDITDIITKITK